MSTSQRLVLEPAASFISVARQLEDWDGGATDLVAGLGDEPISARWTRGDLEVRYSANPAIGLRVIEGSGVEEVAGRLRLTGERAVLLAGSSDPGEVLLGITALGLLGDLHALPTLERLVASRGAEHRGAAELAIRRIGMTALSIGRSVCKTDVERTPTATPS